MKNFFYKKNLLYTMFFFLFFSSCGFNKRFINVTGRASSSNTPDQVAISFSVFSNDKDISSAKTKNDEAIKRLQLLFEEYGIEQNNISIERVNINPRYRYNESGYQIFVHYEIVQNICVLLTRIENYENFLTGLLNTGIDRVSNVVFSVKDINSIMDKVRREAVKAAEKKALQMCSSLERKASLGKVISITENPINGYQIRNEVKNYKEAVFDSESKVSTIG